MFVVVRRLLFAVGCLMFAVVRCSSPIAGRCCLLLLVVW